MAKFYNARNDKVFKAIFFDPNDTELLETLLSLTFNTKVTDIKFNNPEQNVIKRAKTYDFTAHLDNKIAHIELTNKYDQSKNFYYFINFYRKYAESQYNPNDIFIHIDYTYGLSEDYNPILCYSLQTDDQIKLFDNMYLLEFNMDKIKNLWPNITDKKKKQLFYYLSKLNMGKDELGKDDDDAFVKKLKNKMQKLNQDKNFINFLSREDDNIIEDK